MDQLFEISVGPSQRELVAKLWRSSVAHLQQCDEEGNSCVTNCIGWHHKTTCMFHKVKAGMTNEQLECYRIQGHEKLHSSSYIGIHKGKGMSWVFGWHCDNSGWRIGEPSWHTLSPKLTYPQSRETTNQEDLHILRQNYYQECSKCESRLVQLTEKTPVRADYSTNIE